MQCIMALHPTVFPRAPHRDPDATPSSRGRGRLPFVTPGTTSRRLAYGPRWEARVRLPKGGEVRLRTVRPDDKVLLVEGFARLSERSRFQRFHGAKSALSERDLRYFTEVDGVDHVAIGALAREGDREVGVGVGRFIRLAEDPEVAEAAVAVLDDWQGRGLGRTILRHLVQAALERGIRRFQCEVLVENAPMRALFKEISAETEEHPDGPAVTMVVPLTAAGTRRRPPAEEILALAARRVLRVFGLGAKA